MKKLILSLIVIATSLTAMAQQFVIIDGQVDKGYGVVVQEQQAFLADDIESIRYEKDPEFILMADAIAGDQKIQLFSQALQLTGLADSLSAYYDYDYDGRDFINLDGRYYVNTHFQYVEMLRRRYLRFTAFVETDEVLAAHGITTLDDLKAYAKTVYDEVYPEDAGITDPTDRRHSLNRFVAYHLLPFADYGRMLTAFPNFFNQNLADVADWYPTLMPHASLKVSNPRTANEPSSSLGYFLNRRGLQEGPDKYGVQVPGIKIDLMGSYDTRNGVIFYIDDILTYDKKTQTEALQERWRVDFVTLSTDFLNAQTRHKMASSYDPPESPSSAAIGFVSEYTQGISWNDDANLFIAPIRSYYWCYGGDEVYMTSENNRYDVSIDLPSLPEGDWELRLGTCRMPSAPVVRFSLDNEVICDNVSLATSSSSSGSAEEGWLPGPAEYRYANVNLDISSFWTENNSSPMSSAKNLSRRIIGRFHSDGKTDHQLRITSISAEGNAVLDLDYLEFCPVSIADHPTIPED